MSNQQSNRSNQPTNQLTNQPISQSPNLQSPVSNLQSPISNLQSPISNLQSPTSNLLPLLILLIATFLRLHHLPDLPPGLNFDEAGNGVAALDILNGEPRLWWTIGGGKEPLWPYLVALSTAIFDPIPLALRLPAVLIGILTVAVAYPLMLSLTRSRTIAILTMLGLALSDWHLHFSRLGFRAILFPLLSALAIYFFWKALSRITHPPNQQTTQPTNQPIAQSPNLQSPISSLQSLISNPHSLIPILYSSFFTALAIYSYLAARLLPLVFILFGLLYCLLNRRHFRPILILISTFFILTATFLIPLIIHFIRYPADFLARSTTVSIFNPNSHNGDLIGTAWQTLTLTLSTFLGLHGDPNSLVNLPLQPAIPLFLAPFFLIGLATSFYFTLKLLISNYQLPITNLPISPSPNLQSPVSNLQSPVSSLQSPISNLLLLAWWLITLLPALLAPEGAPHHLRLLGTIIPTYAFIALGIITTLHLLTRLFQPKSQTTKSPISSLQSPVSSPPSPHLQLPITNYQLLITLLLFATLASHTYANYFTHWPNTTDFTLPFDLYATRLAADIAQTPPGTGYVLPMDIRAADEARHYTIDYLLADQPNAPYSYIPVDERNAEQGLTKAAQNQEQLRVVRWTDDKHREADAKEIVTYLLVTNGELTGREIYPVYEVETYSLTEPPPFTLPAIDQPLGATFNNLLRLDAAYLPSQVIPGDDLPIALTLAPLAPMESDYKASLRLIDSTGAQITQKDRQLKHNFHQGTSLWPPETVNEYYLLPIPPETPPGDYTIVVVLYHPDTLTPLVADGLVEVPVGRVRVGG